MRCFCLVSSFFGVLTQQIHSLRESSVSWFHFSWSSFWEVRIFLRSSGSVCTLHDKTSCAIFLYLVIIIFPFLLDHIILYSKAYTSKFSKYPLELKKRLIFFQWIQSYIHYRLEYGDNREVYWVILPKKNDLVKKFFGRILPEIWEYVSYLRY